jgi:glutamyl-tRNA reductase
LNFIFALIPTGNPVVQILTLGLNHKTAPVEIREKLSFTAPAQKAALARLMGEYELHEAAILSTCNRSEIYVASDSDGLIKTKRFLAETQGIDPQGFEPYFYAHSNGEAAIHLFRVASGIDSLVIGESQILGQVREALETAQQHGAARQLINELFQRSLRVGKRARSETGIGHGRLSISTAAVELVGQVFDRLDGRQALLLGAGEMGELTAQYLLEEGIGQLLIANRTYQRAVEVAGRVGGKAVGFDAWTAQLAHIDIIVSSTAATDFVITPQLLKDAMRQRRSRPLFLIDIAVPRDIDPQVRQLDNVFLFDIDDLEQVVESNRHEREQEVRQVQALIEEEMTDFLHWFNSLGTGTLIKDLRQHADTLCQQEMDKWAGKLAHLPEADRRTVEALMRGYTNKLLHQPQVQIRNFANSDNGYLRLDTVRRLFGLGED